MYNVGLSRESAPKFVTVLATSIRSSMRREIGKCAQREIVDENEAPADGFFAPLANATILS